MDFVGHVSSISQLFEESRQQYLEEKTVVDSIVNLSKGTDVTSVKLSNDKTTNTEDGYMVLLSEGVFLYDDGTVRMYMPKGKLKEWYDNLSQDYEGYITTGHTDLYSTPVREGYFTKENLKLVENEDGRYDVLVKPQVNTELSRVKDLIIQDEPFAISAELSYYEKQDYTDDDVVEYAKLVAYNLDRGGSEDISVVGDLSVQGFSFVANPGNAKSGGYSPRILLQNNKEVLKLNKTQLLDKIIDALNQKPTATVDEPVVEEPVVDEPEVTEPTVEEPVVEEPVVEEPEVNAVEELSKQVELLLEEREELKKELAEVTAERDVLKSTAEQVDSKLETLSKLLGNSTVVEPTVKEKAPKQVVSRFGRQRFGGQQA